MQLRDLKAQYGRYREEIDEAIRSVLERAAFIGGKEVGELEEELADYAGVKHCISCANGTEAMSLMLMAWGIGKGDAVFVPDFTFFSTGEVVSFCGATPVFVDVDRDTFNIDLEKLDRAIVRVIEEFMLNPRVIIPVDLFGLPADCPGIKHLIRGYHMWVLEDGAQGFGGRIGEKKACSFGHAATTSFFPAKPLGCYGDGGAVFTDNDTWAEKVRSLKVHGKGEGKYDNVRIGLNSRLDTIQAAVLKVKLKAFKEHELEDVNRVAGWYREFLDGVVELPVVPEGFYSSWAQYTIKLKNRAERDGLQAYLKEQGIPSAVYYQKPMHQQGAYAHMNLKDEDFPVSTQLSETVLSLPMHPYLSRADVEKVCQAAKKYLRS